MATNMVKQNKMKMTLTKKSHSWWWDSHISPKNSKWLQENLEEMDQYIKRMLKLVEEDADSLAKKAELYYQKRPELINLVEEFYRMYRALAERYDHVTGELRKSIPSHLQLQGSGISDRSSELPSTMPSPDRRPSQPKSGPRAAGFEFFLGAGASNKEADESSTLDSESGSDDSSVNNYAAIWGGDDDQGLRRRINELEVELRDVKEKLQMAQEEISEGFDGRERNEESKILLSKIAAYEEELRISTEKIGLSEEQISSLKDELEKYKLMEVARLNLDEDLKLTKAKLVDSDKEVTRMKLELQNCGLSIQSLKDQLGRDQEIRGLGETISIANKSLSEENSQLEAEITQLVKEKTYLEDNLKEMDLRCQSLEEDIRRIKVGKAEMEAILGSEIEELKAAIAEKNNRIESLMAGKDALDAKITFYITVISSRDAHINEMNKHLHQLHMEHVKLLSRAEGTNKQMEELRSRITELEREVESSKK